MGFNFYPPSPRFVNLGRAADIVATLPARISRVGVFVNEEPSKTLQIANDLSLDYVQLHGNESIEDIQALQGQPYIRAFRLGADDMGQVVQFLSDCRRLDCLPAAVLVDAHVVGQYGGTGKTIDWQLLSQQRTALGGVPLILAGGLTPANVAESIRIVRPEAVDTASGVETEPGIKSERLIEEFVTRSLAAFSEDAC
jgi:phosphoribosylanthranilate isomerase